jgi:hypothetical protein
LAEVEVTSAEKLIRALRGADGGETIIAQGVFGHVVLDGVRPETPVTIVGDRGAHFDRLVMRGCANLRWTGLSLWPTGPLDRMQVPEGGQGRALPYLALADEDCAGIEIARSIFRGRKDSDAFSTWAKADWRAARTGAVSLRGARSVVRSNRAIGVFHGFGIGGPGSELFDNVVFGFAGDGLRVNHDNCVVIGNRVTDAVNIDGNHPDGLQVFKKPGTLRGLVIKDNVIVEWTVRPDNPLRRPLQGIGLHNGPYRDVVIRDNRIAISSYNGIHVNAATNVEVTGNIVRHVDGQRGNRPRIWLSNCDGKVVLADNQAEKFMPPIGQNNREPDYATGF